MLAADHRALHFGVILFVEERSDSEGKLRLNIPDLHIAVPNRTSILIMLVLTVTLDRYLGTVLERVGEGLGVLPSEEKRPSPETCIRSSMFLLLLLC